MKTTKIWMMVSPRGDLARNYSTGTRVYTRKHNAVALRDQLNKRCYSKGDYVVMEFDLSEGKVVE